MADVAVSSMAAVVVRGDATELTGRSYERAPCLVAERPVEVAGPDSARTVTAPRSLRRASRDTLNSAVPRIEDAAGSFTQHPSRGPTVGDSTNEITLEMIRRHLFSAVVSDALDSLGFAEQSPRLPFFPVTKDDLLVGRAKTTLWEDVFERDPAPYELELRAVDACRPDDVFVAATGSSRRSAIWGELLSTAARNRGCAGALVDGLARDVRAMRKLDFTVYALGTSPYDSKDRQKVIELDIPVEIGGVRFDPGALLLADRDGVVVVPPEVEKEVIQRAWDKVHAENEVRDAIRAGMSAAEAFERFGIL